MRISVLILLSISVLSCKKEKPLVLENTKEIITEASSIDKFKNTDFVFALEESFSEGKNEIYSPTVLLAWDEVRNFYKTPFTAEKESSDFQILNNSKSYKNVLDKNEYSTKVDFNPYLKITTRFKNNFSYKNEFQNLEPLDFKGTKVQAFGDTQFPDSKYYGMYLEYYKSDSDFILRVMSNEGKSMMYLIKTKEKFNNFNEVYSSIDEKSSSQNNIENLKLQKGDVFVLPKIEFNILKEFKQFSNFRLKDALGKEHEINELTQMNSFKLDEFGAKIESEADIAMDAAKSASEKIIQPKKLIFDDIFYVVFKKSQAENPYFALKITDSELMFKSSK